MPRQHSKHATAPALEDEFLAIWRGLDQTRAELSRLRREADAHGLVTSGADPSIAAAQLGVPYGGTGDGFFTPGSFLIGDGVDPLESVGPGISGQIPISDGLQPVMHTITGDASLSSLGVLTLSTSLSPTFAGLTIDSLNGVLKASAGVVSGSGVNIDGSNFVTGVEKLIIDGTNPGGLITTVTIDPTEALGPDVARHGAINIAAGVSPGFEITRLEISPDAFGAAGAPQVRFFDGSTGRWEIVSDNNLTLRMASGKTFSFDQSLGGITKIGTGTGVFVGSSGVVSTVSAVSVTRGGTGLSTLTSGAFLTGAGTGNVALVGPGTSGQIPISSGSAPVMKSLNGDATLDSLGALTLVSTITAGGPTGSSTVIPVITYDAKGRLTAVTTASLASYQPLDATLTALAAYNANGLLTQTAADTFTGRTITGTTNRLTVTNGDGVAGDPTLDISTSYVGQATITTLGTVATGTWQATKVGLLYGGTNQTAWTAGTIVQVNAGGTALESTPYGFGDFALATTSILTPSGSGLTGGGTLAADRTLQVVVDGSTLEIATNTIRVKDAGITLAKMANLATDRLIGRDTVGTGVPEALTVGGGIEFTGSLGIQTSAFTGHVTKAAGGTVTTISADTVTVAMMHASTTDVFFGRHTAGSGAGEELSVATAKTMLNLTGTNSGDQTITLTGDVTGSGTGSFAATIANDAVTYAKMQNVSATDKVLGRSTAGAGDVEEIAFTSTARSLCDDTSTSAMRTTLGLTIGTDVQAFDNTLAQLALFNTNGLLTQTAADTFAGRTITGTSARISVSNGSGVAGNPTIDIDASYVGQTSITTLGTVATGTWTASTVGILYGGTGAADAAGAFLNIAANAIQFTSDISPSQITADQNNYNPASLSSASSLRLSTDASRNLTGLAGGNDGRVLWIHNVGSFDLVLKDESASSTSTNRFALSADVTLTPDQSAMLWYDSTTQRWRMIGGTGGSSGAPVGASYLTLGTDATLTSERVLTAGSGIGFTDAGAGSTLTVALGTQTANWLTSAGAFEHQFRAAGNRVYSSAADTLDVEGNLFTNIGKPGNCDFGDTTTVYSFRPVTTLKADLGTSALLWRDGYFGGDLYVQSELKLLGQAASETEYCKIIMASTALTADRQLTLDINNADRTLSFSTITAHTFDQLLSTAGTPTFAQLTVDNLRLDGSTLSSVNTNGDIQLDPDGTGKINNLSDTQWFGATRPLVLSFSGGGAPTLTPDVGTNSALVISADALFLGRTSTDCTLSFQSSGANSIQFGSGNLNLLVDSSGLGTGRVIVLNNAKVGGTAKVNTTAVGNIGAGEDDLITYSLPANALFADGMYVEITAWGTCAANANAKTIKCYFGATAIHTTATVNQNGGSWRFQGVVVRTGASAEEAFCDFLHKATTKLFTDGTEQTNPAANTGSTITIKCTGTGTSNNDIVQEGLIVKIGSNA